jgi:hypothetical protein
LTVTRSSGVLGKTEDTAPSGLGYSGDLARRELDRPSGCGVHDACQQNKQEQSGV